MPFDTAFLYACATAPECIDCSHLFSLKVFGFNWILLGCRSGVEGEMGERGRRGGGGGEGKRTGAAKGGGEGVRSASVHRSPHVSPTRRKRCAWVLRGQSGSVH